MHAERLSQLLWLQFWQVTLVAIAVGLFVKLTCRSRPHCAHVLWLLVLIKCLTPPLWTSPAGVFSWMQMSGINIAEPLPDQRSAARTLATGSPGNTAPAIRIARNEVPAQPETAAIGEASPDLIAESTWPELATGTSPVFALGWTPLILVGWLSGAAVYLGATAANGWRFYGTIRKAAVVPSAELLQTFNEIKSCLGVRRCVRLCVSRHPVGPMTFGVVRPTILLPAALVESSSSETLHVSVAHELVHVRRGDALVGLLQIAAGALWWFHPLLWWASRQLTIERERSCDEEVITGISCPAASYVRGLLDVLEWKGQARWSAALPGVRSLEITKARLQRLLHPAGGFHARTPGWTWVVALVAGALVLPGAGSAPTDNPLPKPKGAPSEVADARQDEPSIRVTPLVSPDGKRIAYPQVAVGPDGEQRVRIIVGNADGTQRRPLAVDADTVEEVQWYGNDRIAYVTRHGQDGYDLIDLEGHPAGKLAMPPGCDSFFHQALSPDGRWIAYCGNYADVPAQHGGDEKRSKYLKAHPEIKVQHGVFAVELATQQVKQLLAETVANLPAWSRDSRYIAAGVGHYQQKYPLVIIDVATGEIRRDEVDGVGVAWSPNGRALAMTTNIVHGGSWRRGIPLDGTLAVWNIDDAKLNVITRPGVNAGTLESDRRIWVRAGSYGPIWSNDGQWIAFQRTEDRQPPSGEQELREEIWIVRSDGSRPRKVLNHGVEQLAWSADDHELVWTGAGQFGRINLEIDALSLGPTPKKQSGQYTVYGRVTDEHGQPLVGATVRVATGIGTLLGGTSTTTDADGRYELVFSGQNSPQYAIVSPQMTGYYERDLGKAGNLAAVPRKLKHFDRGDWRVVELVYPGNPYEVNFTMLPAASIKAQLVDAKGAPLAKYRISLKGNNLYPATSVMWSGETDEQGRFEIDDVPLKPYWFTVGTRRRPEYKTDPLEFSEAKAIELRLVYDDVAGTLKATTEQ